MHLLIIWPYHVPLGGLGNALDPALWSAVFWHSLARQSQPTWWSKGLQPLTEHYSVVRPEIPPPTEVTAEQEGREFLAALEQYDYTFIADEAESHCVLATAEDLVEEFSGRPEML